MEQLEPSQGNGKLRNQALKRNGSLKQSITQHPSSKEIISNIEWLRSLGSRLVRAYKAIAVVMLNAVIVFICFELAATSAIKIRTGLSSDPEELAGGIDSRSKVSYYAAQDWAAIYWDEFRRSRRQLYYPYVGWRRGWFEGKTINIDQNGVRRTPGANCGPQSFKVFAFGASTMWGTGAPEWGTIPAYLQAGLEKLQSGSICVINYGESGYNSTQELVMLILQLQSGNVPHVVIFYEAPGDIYAAYQSGRAGGHENLDQIAAKFERREEPHTVINQLASTSSYEALRSLVAKLSVDKAGKQAPMAPALITYESKGIDAAKLGDAVVRHYIENYKMVNSLAQKYGFKAFFFLPPIITMGSKVLTREEQEMKHNLVSDRALNKLNTIVYHALEPETSKLINLFSTVQIFDQYSSLIWIDEYHVTPTGNELLAQKIVDVITPRSFQ